ncbi:MAG: trypsin-like peptidase domain-containing protein [Oscillospiraceae bacterium]|jgi:serine protease Do|nr:trypsin-like peptidase domain-containing protein [Oscillospiraceae bacterium]MCI1989916.1 trypsin-like peptidase domain-containing protein [Oscillospiraceae bacterium]MCI2034946.1 trypsin-like peptidase domain-containing protein [Oscillospiraceae bacterium]
MNDQEKSPWENEPKNGGTPSPAQDAGGSPESPSGPENPSGNGGPEGKAGPDGGPQSQEQGGNPQNGGPYAPYGQYGSPYGQYRDPGYYNRYDNPYSPPGGQPYWNPYGPTPPPPHKMNGGLKVFLWVLGVVVVGLLVAFVFYSVQPEAREGLPASSSSSSASSGFNGTLPKDSSSAASGSGSVIGGVQGNGTDPGAAGISVRSKPSGTPLTATTVYKKVIQSVVGVETTISGSGTTAGESETGEGTGIVATADGYILTNAHVVNYSRNNAVKVVLHNNRAYQAKVVGFDKTSDLAVLKINAKDLSPAVFGSVDGMEIGEEVLAIGNPGGLSFAGSLTGGMISALNRAIESHSDNGMTYIQTDAAINPGNSGGPLVNMYGQVIGINSNKIFATGYEGMGFAIPVSRAQSVINELIRNGYVSGRTRLGITGENVGGDAQGSLLGYPQGVLIRSIASDSDMARAGAKVGDVITAAGGKKVTSLDDLYAVLNSHKPGDVISMTVDTNAASGSGSSKTIRVKLLEDKGETQQTG